MTLGVRVPVFSLLTFVASQFSSLQRSAPLQPLAVMASEMTLPISAARAVGGLSTTDCLLCVLDTDVRFLNRLVRNEFGKVAAQLGVGAPDESGELAY